MTNRTARPKDAPGPPADLSNSPIAWWITLETALRDGDPERRELAREQLARIGIGVFLDPKKLRLAGIGLGG